jgi:chlorite dismutase
MIQRFCGVWGQRRNYDEEATYYGAGDSARCVFVVSAEAASNKQKVSADVQASCKAQAAMKYSAIHFMKRRNFVNNCVTQHAKASAPKAKLTTTVKRLNKLNDLKAPLRRVISCGPMDCGSIPQSCLLLVISGHFLRSAFP